MADLTILVVRLGSQTFLVAMKYRFPLERRSRTVRVCGIDTRLWTATTG
jgi:hypothetical protein